MTKRKYKLKELQVIIPLVGALPRSQEVDDMAFEAAQKISATPIKRFKFIDRKPSATIPGCDNLIYSAYGLPKEE